MGKAIFITGTGTDVGKTYVTGLLVKKIRDAGLDGSYYKAALSGAEPDENGNLVPGDAAWVKETAGLPDPLEDLVTYVYREAVSPHLAARINHHPVDLEQIRQAFQKAKGRHQYLTMEGSGGIGPWIWAAFWWRMPGWGPSTVRCLRWTISGTGISPSGESCSTGGSQGTGCRKTTGSWWKNLPAFRYWPV